MSALDKKLLRDLKKIWAQALAAALVLACGVATLIIGHGAYASLFETRAAYYEKSRFADIFATAERAPNRLTTQIANWPGVLAVDSRISVFGLVDLSGFALPITGQFLSLPKGQDRGLNRLTLKSGRMPQIGRNTEAVILSSFAEAHRLFPGMQISAVIKGKEITFTIVGTALSPEFIYAIGPGDMMPDNARFGVFWILREELESVSGLSGAFNSITLQVSQGTARESVSRNLDSALEDFGGTAATPRSEQTSHAFLDAELKQLETMSRILPPVFLVVTAFLINMILTRLISLEREQIGLLKALGYGAAAVTLHYVKLVLLIVAVGVAIGLAAGIWLGYGLTSLYQRFFHFPYLVFVTPLSAYALAVLTSAGAALAGAFRAVSNAATLPPAIAMQPPAPPIYHKAFSGITGHFRFFSQLTVMAFRHMLRWPLRATTTSVGIAVSIALLVSSLFSLDAVDFMLDFTFEQSDRQDATISLAAPAGLEALWSVRKLPGVLAAEPLLVTSVELSHDAKKKRVGLTGHIADADISRILDDHGREVILPEHGLVLSKTLAAQLGVSTGNSVDIRFFRERVSRASVPVAAIVEGYFGQSAYMQLTALNQILRQEQRMSAAVVLLDSNKSAAFYERSKKQPALSMIALQRVALASFRKTLGENIMIQIGVYAALGATIAFGVVYNSARIQFSERARELASLRVLGFGAWEVQRVILVEFVMLTAAAIPIGWAMGAGLAYALVEGFSSDLYRVPFVIGSRTYAASALVVVVAVALSLALVLRRAFKLDLIGTLKTRD